MLSFFGAFSPEELVHELFSPLDRPDFSPEVLSVTANLKMSRDIGHGVTFDVSSSGFDGQNPF